jgi:hypothetical protein
VNQGGFRLAHAAAIEKKVELYKKSTLYDQVWEPIEEALPAGTKSVILSPDGDLNFISFAAAERCR